VRELQNYVEQALVLATGDVLTVDLFPPQVRGQAPLRVGRGRPREILSLCRELVALGMTDTDSSGSGVYEYVVSMAEKTLIQHVLNVCEGVRTKAALRLGVHRNTLKKKIQDYGLEAEPT
jgi:DNA-binding NtrC family response regulator